MKKIAILTSVFFLSLSSISQNTQDRDELLGGGLNTITTSVPFLIITPDSRSGGMGDVGVATSPDVNSQHWNPAKYSFIEDELGFSISYVPWLRALVPDINLGYITGFKKLDDNQAVSLDLRHFSLGNITFTNKYGDVIGQYDPNEFSIGSSYSRRLSDNFSLAISGRYIYSNLTGGQSAGEIQTEPGQSIAADISGYYFKELRFSGKDYMLAFGTNISNIGNKVSYTLTDTRDFIPINLRLGTSFSGELDDYNRFSFSIDLNKLLVPTPPLYDSDQYIDSSGTQILNPNYQKIIAGKDDDVSVVNGIFQSFSDAPGGLKEELREINLSFGTEYWYAEQFAVRLGYFYEHDTKGGRKFFTFGSGVKYTVFSLDFSYLVDATTSVGATNPLANTMRFTLTYNFAENN